MIVSLPELARQAGVKREVVLPDIVPTKALEADLQAIYMEGVKVWREGIVNLLLPSYVQPIAIFIDATPAETASIIGRIYDAAENRILYQTPKLARWVSRVGVWNGEKTISAAKSATGVEIRPYMRLIDVQDQLDEAIRLNVSMFRTINADTRSRIENIMADAIVNRRNKKYVTKAMSEALGISQRRARNAAGDQLHKLNVALTSIRNQELGISKFKWVTRGDGKVRPLHVTYGGKVFRWDKPPADGLPGFPINCRCTARSVFGGDD